MATRTLPTPAGARERHALPAAATLFVLSGVAALVYQVAWQRILALHTGVSVHSVALIVAAFMAGLGLGSHLGGAWSRRLERRAALRAFACVELGVGLFAAQSAWLYYDVLYLRAAPLYDLPWRAALLHLLALLPPTTLMGMSLPLLARALVHDGLSAPRTLGILYGLNVAGAALGAWLAPWVLIRHLGVRGALLAGACASLLTGLGALGLRRLVPGDEAPAPVCAVPAGRPPHGSLRLWLLLYGLSGFCALAFEVLWFRLLDVAVKSTAFTFGTLLAAYLTGSAAGALMAARAAARLERPLRAFLLCQCAIPVLAALGVLALVRLPPDAPLLRHYIEYWSRTDGFRLGRAFEPQSLLSLYVLLPLVLFGLPTVLMGLSFPILQRAVQDDPRSAGFKVGALQAANILGCVLGSLAVGLVALDRLGSAGTLRAVVALGLVFAALGLRLPAAERRPFGWAAAALALALALLPGERELWQRLHGLEGRAAAEALLAEDATGVVALARRATGEWDLTVNGTWNSALPFGGIHALLGALPAIVHRAPEHVGVIGLGSGNTAWAAACRSTTRHVRVYEICSPQQRLLHELAGSSAPPARLRRLLKDPRLELRFADGRRALQADAARYDTLEVDALRPYHALSGNLYSLEFFEACGRRLRPGGLMCSWAPTPRVQATFTRAFAHVLEFSEGRVLLGSNEPLPLEPQTWLARLHSAELHAYLGGENVDALATALKSARPALRRPVPEGDLNSDLWPRDEFATPR